MRIAAIITCHNRKEKTLACLKSLFQIIQNIDVYLTDDGSTDGTAKAVKRLYSQVKVIHGDGNLFWSRGMYTAWKEAVKGDYDYYLWLNDDIELYPFFMKELFECEEIEHNEAIISGIIESFDKQTVLYGGTDRNGRLIAKSEKPMAISHMNGNVVLIPKSVVDTIGIMDPKFHHDLGDVDYGLTAIEHGIDVYATRIPIAAGYSNNFCRVRKWGTSMRKRFKKLYSPLGSDPRINFYFRKKHIGLCNACLYWLFLHAINLMPDNLISLVFGNKYKDK